MQKLVDFVLGGVHPLKLLATLGTALLGGVVALALNLPAPLLIGGIVTVGIASLLKFDTRVPLNLVNAAFVIIGLLIGSNVSSDTLSLVGQWPWSMAGVFVGLVLMVSLTTLLMIFAFRLDPITAYLSSVPGHLSMVMSMATDGHGDVARVVTIQSVRLLFLTLAVPILALVLGMIPETIGAAPVEMDWSTLLVLTVTAICAGLILKRLNMPAPMVIGPMLVAVLGKLTGLYDGVLPQWLAAIGLVILGAQIGGRMTKVSAQDLKRDLLAGVIMTVFMIATTALFAWGLSLVMDMPPAQIWLGLAPGGLDAIGPLGLALGFDTAFIAAHQTWRLLILGVAIPLGPPIIRKFTGQPHPDKTPPAVG